VIDSTVRPATGDDVAAIAWLEDLARAALADRRGGPRWLESHPPHGGRPGRSDAAWVATIDDVVVGYLMCERAGDIVRIRDVFVHPEARDLGFGDALLAAAVGAGREWGARLLEGEALPGDRETKNLYERAGIKARLIVVSTPL
jgi:GNAT superfamily N-acetyltransferase